MMFLVRHADAGDKASWNGPDVLRPLSPEGWRQAEGLVVRLDDFPVDRILCSPTVRCHETVQPLARDRLIRIERIAALGVDASPAEVMALFWDRQLRNTVLCTHGETIGPLLSRLAADGLVAAAPLQWPKGSTWLLQRIASRQVRARYLAPLALGGRVELPAPQPDHPGSLTRARYPARMVDLR
jgi:phosphohistidine phosphatase SixA